MKTDKNYCMSSYLMLRAIADHNRTFADGIRPRFSSLSFERRPVKNSGELEEALRSQMAEETKDGKAALALSGGMDSAILAKWMPSGSVAYTFRCVVPGVKVTDETPAAARYAEECGLKHRVVEIFWEDFETYAPILMKRKGAPIHSIEVQIYKAALQAKADGFGKLVFGEHADLIYGGMDGLLAKDWLIGEFIDRYTYVMPYKALKDPRMITEPYAKFEKDGRLDAYGFINEVFRAEALGSYRNACDSAGTAFSAPYANTYLDGVLDLTRIRGGDSKYIVRELFKKLYGIDTAPDKIPMPRPMNEWLKSWGGPVRPEFWPHCTDGMTGDQKWMVFCLERFLNLLEEWA